MLCLHTRSYLSTESLLVWFAPRPQVEARLRSWPLGRLRSEGLVLLELRGAKRGAYFGKAIVRLTAAGGGELPFHRFT